MKEYVGLQLSDEDDKYIGQTFNPIDNEDLMATNQLPNMQEMANAPFGPDMNLTKDEYAKQLAELEEAERKHNEGEANEPGVPRDGT